MPAKVQPSVWLFQEERNCPSWVAGLQGRPDGVRLLHVANAIHGVRSVPCSQRQSARMTRLAMRRTTITWSRRVVGATRNGLTPSESSRASRWSGQFRVCGVEDERAPNLHPRTRRLHRSLPAARPPAGPASRPLFRLDASLGEKAPADRRDFAGRAHRGAAQMRAAARLAPLLSALRPVQPRRRGEVTPRAPLAIPCRQ